MVARRSREIERAVHRGIPATSVARTLVDLASTLSLDALALARQYPDTQVVFFAVGFETTAPANAMAVYQAHREGLTNFSLLVAHVLVPPAMARPSASEEL